MKPPNLDTLWVNPIHKYKKLRPQQSHHYVPISLRSHYDAIINNKGTLPTWVKLNLTSKHDNGYFGIVGVEGAMEFGKREEVDGVTIRHSDVLYDSKTDPKFSKFVSAAGQPHPEWTGAGTNGTIN